jgi:hypothetical protein
MILRNHGIVTAATMEEAVFLALKQPSSVTFR